MAVKLGNKHYTYIITVIAGTLLLSGLVGYFVVRPLLRSNSSYAKEVKENKDLLDALETKLETLKSLKSKERELLAEKERVLAALPEDKDVSRLFIQVEKIVSD